MAGVSIFQAHGAELAFWIGGAVVLIGAAAALFVGAVKLTWWLRDMVGRIIGHLQALDAKLEAVNARLDTLNGQVAKNTKFREDQHDRLAEATEISARTNREVLQRLDEMRREKEARSA